MQRSDFATDADYRQALTQAFGPYPKVGATGTCAKCGHPIRFNDTDLFGNVVNRWQHTEGSRAELGTLHSNTPIRPA